MAMQKDLAQRRRRQPLVDGQLSQLGLVDGVGDGPQVLTQGDGQAAFGRQ